MAKGKRSLFNWRVTFRFPQGTKEVEVEASSLGRAVRFAFEETRKDFRGKKLLEAIITVKYQGRVERPYVKEEKSEETSGSSATNGGSVGTGPKQDCSRSVDAHAGAAEEGGGKESSRAGGSSPVGWCWQGDW